ncbi:MAG: F0F1 ATP synthase subunit delta [Nocardioidaceae bacterium]
MEGGSTKSLRHVLDTTSEVLSGGADATAVGNDLFALALTLDGAHSLRRAFTEPAVPVESKNRLMRSLLGDKLGDGALDITEAAIGQRWSRTRDLADALEQASVSAHVARADDEGHLDDLEDNLFRFSRIVEGSPALREALSDTTTPLEAKRSLLGDLLGDKVDDSTRTLLGQAVAGRHHALSSVLATYQRVAAGRRDSMIATVWVAAPLSDEHRERLATALGAQHSKTVHLNVVVDKTLLGGVRVAVGDEVLDSTVETRLQQAQRRLER